MSSNQNANQPSLNLTGAAPQPNNTAALQAEITKLKAEIAKLKEAKKAKAGEVLPFGYSLQRIGGQLEVVVNAKERDAAEHVVSAGQAKQDVKQIIKDVKAYYGLDIDEAQVREILAYTA